MSSIQVRKRFQLGNPGCLSPKSVNQMHLAVEKACRDPSWFCDLESCGPVAELEKAIKPLVGGNHVLAVSSGTAALHTACLAAGVQAGDRFITSAVSWPQTVSPFVLNGAEPVWSDIDAATGHLDPVETTRLISGWTKAIVVPCLFGSIADLPTLQMLANTAGMLLIADAAQAMGAKYYDKPVGNFADISCYSLGRGKLVSAGEGGIVTFKRREHYERALMLTQHPDRYFRETGKRCSGFGLNYRMHPWQAVAGLAALEDMQTKLDHRRNAYKAFIDQLRDVPSIEHLHIPYGVDHAAYGIVLMAESEECRSALLRKSFEQGLDIHAGPIAEPLHVAFTKGRINPNEPWLTKSVSLLNADKFCFEQQIWPLMPLQMDEISIEQAVELGQKFAAPI